MNTLPLAGRRVLVTRGAGQAAKLSDGLRVLGAIPVEVPVLEIQPPESYGPLDAAVRRLSSYDWILLTSANAVRALVERAAVAGVPLGCRDVPQVAVVGAATAAAARAAGLAISVVPERYVAESLVAALVSQIPGKRVLLARAAVARDVIPDALRAAGAVVDVVDAYRNGIPKAAPELLREALAERIDAATFTSSSSATHLAEVARQAGIAFPLAGVASVSIGPITSETLREVGWPPAVEAEQHDIPGLISAVVAALESR